MNPITKTACGRTLALITLPYAFAVVAWLLAVSSAVAADDPYLQMLDEEATKVGGVATDSNTRQDVADAVPGVPREAPGVPSRAEFEELLRVEHVGTYSFYRRLPERSREEIFIDYSKGASMESLRGKIVDRYLHP